MNSTPSIRFTFIFILVACGGLIASGSLAQAASLRVLVAGEAEGFRADYSAALEKSGAQVTTATSLDPAALSAVDVLLLQRGKFEPLPAQAQAALTAFAQRGGGIVAVNAAVAAGDAAWGRTTLGGGWNPAESQKFTSRMMLYMRTDSHPIVREASSFDIDDDTLYDLALDDNAFVLASAFTPKVTAARRTNRQQSQNPSRASIYDIQPQMWTFEGAKHRAFVLLPGAATTLKHASVRAFLLRAVAWTGHRENVDEFCAKRDLANLRYPVGGPLRAADEIEQFRMQPGFKATVVAAEPLITKPIAVQWDARGRLWVAETPEYPNGRRPLSAEPWKEGGVLDPGHYDRPARDRISVLSKPDANGQFTKKTIFHEGLELVTGFCMYRDGVIAVAQPNIVWLRDTDGDGKADQEIPIFGGFTPGDTHFVSNHFIQAPDGWIYASTGSGATATNPKTKEVVAKISPGVFRFKPDGSAIEQVASQGGNTFGAEVTSDLEIFHGKATSGNPIQHVVLPEWVLARAGSTTAKSMNSVNPGRPVARKDMPDRAPLMQIDQVGHYSAACSTLVYEGGAWPKEYDGAIFCTEPILDIIHHERLKPAGASFAGELLLQDAEWLRSMDYWFCPVDVTFGPDGAMYVLDFYTPVVAHNDTRGPSHSKSGASIRPDREHYFGRIYRIQFDGAPKLAQPDLTTADASALVAAFGHPNRVVRFNALRVLMEKADTLGTAAVPALTTMATGETFAPARILALWALQRLGRMTPATLAAAATAPDAGVRKNAMLIAEAGRIPLGAKELAATLNDNDARVRLAALRAAGAAPISAETGALLLALQSKLDDPWSKAALSAALSSSPGPQLEAMLAGGEVSREREDFARSLAASLAENADPASVLRVLQAAAKSANARIAAIVVQTIGQHPPAAAAEAVATLRALLSSPDRALAGAALPLAIAWDKGGTLKDDTTHIIAELFTIAKDTQQPADRRGDAVRALVAARRANAEILHGVIALFAQPQPEEFRRTLIAALAGSGEIAAGSALADAFPGLPTTARDAAFDALAGRPAWSALLLDAMEAKKFAPGILGPVQVSRLTAHPDAATAARAKKLLTALGSGANPAKDEIIARLRPAVEQPGNAAKGRETFAATCSICHRLAGVGFEFGPALDGIGSHPAAELLMHIVDPSRAVDDEHRTWNFTMKDGTQYSALIASENSASVKLRQPAGVTVELKAADIASRQKVATSLMPEGFESLGAETMRDLIAYIQSVAPKVDAPGIKAASGSAGGGMIVPVSALSGNFRPLDVSAAFTADTRKGLFASDKATRDSLPFVKFGRVVANGVPFDITDPAKQSGGKNVIVLKGGPNSAFARTMPQRVEIPVGVAASRLHFLGGVAGWGAGSAPVMTATLQFAGGATQVAELHAGREFADYIRRIEVPGSKFADGVVSEHQVRTFAIPVQQAAVIEKLILESSAGRIAPTTVAITAELGAPAGPAPATPAASKPAPIAEKSAPAKSAAAAADDPKTIAPMGQKFAEPKPSNTLRVLLVGAGSSHNFPRFFLGVDTETLRTSGGIDTAATPNLDEALALLPQADVLVLSANHPQFGQPAFQVALNKFADAGKGIVVLHAGTWLNWAPACGFNHRFVGGGAKSHGHGNFTVTVKQPAHPLLRGVPASFEITDENYHAEIEPGATVEILAENAPDHGAAHPSVWIVKDPKTRIACITLGHADEAHSHPAFKTLLTNAVRWTAGK